MDRGAAHAAIVLILTSWGWSFTWSLSDVADDILDALEALQLSDQAEPVTLREEDLAFTYFHVSSDPVDHGPRGVTLTHVPTGTVVHKWAAQSQLENTARALQQLRLELEEDSDSAQPP